MINQNLRKGFTLVELLIVIAVLGVLAAIVLVALNPNEQLNRGRDASRLSGVVQLGAAMQSYSTAQGGGTFPTPSAGNSWQTPLLLNNKEINNVVTVPAAVGGASANCVGTLPVSNEGNVCYTANGSGSDAWIWTIDESQASKNKASCGATQVPAAVWEASQGKAGVACLNSASTVPGTGIQLN